MNAANALGTCMLGLGSNCVVYMMQQSSTKKSIVSKVVDKKGRQSRSVQLRESNIYEGVDEGCWWFGQVQKIRRKIGTRLGISRTPIDL